MKIVYMGTPDFAVNSLERLIQDGHEIVGVFTQPDKPQGRKMKLTPPPVKQLALTHDIPVYQPDSFKNESQLELLRELNPEVIIVVASENCCRAMCWICRNTAASMYTAPCCRSIAARRRCSGWCSMANRPPVSRRCIWIAVWIPVIFC